MKNTLKKCVRCGLPETYETIEFDDQGLCNICKSTEYKHNEVDWAKRKRQLDKLIEKHKGKYSYDCIVPFSGGKDSTFQLLYLMREYKLKPLVVRFNHGFMRKTIDDNCTRTFKKLGVDVLEFTPNWHIVKKLMLESFVRKTDFCWHCHTGIFSYPLRVALMYKVPLVIWGEGMAEVTAYHEYSDEEIEYEDDKKFNMLRTLGITAEDMYNMLKKNDPALDIRDLTPYTFPDVGKLNELGYCSVSLGSYIPWDYAENSKLIKKELGWQADTVEGVPYELNEHGEKIECFMQASRDYIKYVKRGYSRISQLNAIKVRKGNMTPAEAQRINEELDGRKPESLEIFLEYVGLTENEFNEIVKSMTIPPYEHDFSSDIKSEKAWDYDMWYREDNR